MNTIQKKIGIIGMGNMGQAICRALQSILSSDYIFVTDHHAAALKNCQTVHVCETTEEVISSSDYIFLAFKPKDLTAFSEQFKNSVDQKVLISVLAGVTRSTLKRQLNCERMIRTMPNLCIKTGKGVIGWMPLDAISLEEKKTITSLFSTMGLQLEVHDENQLDAITAISGSGPAYFFYLTEILMQKAIEFGFSKIQAEQLAEMTCIGASDLLENDRKSAKTWKENVTSPNGTTEAALNALKENKFDELFKQAIQKAYDRAQEISVS